MTVDFCELGHFGHFVACTMVKDSIMMHKEWNYVAYLKQY